HVQQSVVVGPGGAGCERQKRCEQYPSHGCTSVIHNIIHNRCRRLLPAVAARRQRACVAGGAMTHGGAASSAPPRCASSASMVPSTSSVTAVRDRASVRVVPVGTHTHVHAQRHAERGRIHHALAHRRAHLLNRVLAHLEHQLVV